MSLSDMNDQSKLLVSMFPSLSENQARSIIARVGSIDAAVEECLRNPTGNSGKGSTNASANTQRNVGADGFQLMRPVLIAPQGGPGLDALFDNTAVPTGTFRETPRESAGMVNLNMGVTQTRRTRKSDPGQRRRRRSGGGQHVNSSCEFACAAGHKQDVGPVDLGRRVPPLNMPQAPHPMLLQSAGSQQSQFAEPYAAEIQTGQVRSNFTTQAEFASHGGWAQSQAQAQAPRVTGTSRGAVYGQTQQLAGAAMSPQSPVQQVGGTRDDVLVALTGQIQMLTAQVQQLQVQQQQQVKQVQSRTNPFYKARSAPSTPPYPNAVHGRNAGSSQRQGGSQGDSQGGSPRSRQVEAAFPRKSRPDSFGSWRRPPALLSLDVTCATSAPSERSTAVPSERTTPTASGRSSPTVSGRSTPSNPFYNAVRGPIGSDVVSMSSGRPLYEAR